MKKPALRLAPLAALLVAGCSYFRVSGYSQEKGRPPEATDQQPLRISSATAGGKPETFTEEELNALYYYDLGPASIDVSRYPKNQQANYEVFARVCSKCHTLARPINSPRSHHVAWEYYVFRMRLRSQFQPGTKFSKEEARVILKFLDYDSDVRKGRYRDDFEALTKKLERRFDHMLWNKIRRMQEGHPLLPPQQ